MKIECQSCNTRFKLDESLLKKEGSKVRCSKCKEIVTVYPPGEQKKSSSESSSQSNKKSNKRSSPSIHEAEIPDQDSSEIDEKSTSKNNTPRLMILTCILNITLTGSIAYHFKYLDVYAVVIMSGILCGSLWPQLRNIFSGVWLKIYPPFQVGERVCVDNMVQGYVLQIDYCTTKLKTDNSAIVSIPNTTLIHNKIVNYSIYPEAFPLSCAVEVDINNTPDRVRKILLDAALPVKGVSTQTAPYTAMKKVSGNGLTQYMLYYFIDDDSLKSKAVEEIWDRIWHLFKRAGILPYVSITSDDKKDFVSMLNEVDIFRPFTDYAKSYMSKNMDRRTFSPDTYVFHQGDEGNSLFIIEEGVVSVQVEITPGKSIEVARLGAGSFFGEMALLTGEGRTANIIAISETILFEITREHIAPLIEEQPQISKSLSELLVQRKIETESKKNKYRAEKINRKALKREILKQIESHFG